MMIFYDLKHCVKSCICSVMLVLVVRKHSLQRYNAAARHSSSLSVTCPRANLDSS